VTIAAFAPQLHVISSKQRPRKLTIHGGDGAEYMFLLKVRAWHEAAFASHMLQPWRGVCAPAQDVFVCVHVSRWPRVLLML